MVNTAGMLKCNRCGKSFHVRSMVADASGKGLICQKCFDLVSKVRTDADRLIQKKFMSVEQGVKARTKASKETAQRIQQGKEYVCKACNYHFISALPVKKCPYCGEENRLTIMEELTKEIDDILKG